MNSFSEQFYFIFLWFTTKTQFAIWMGTAWLPIYVISTIYNGVAISPFEWKRIAISMLYLCQSMLYLVDLQSSFNSRACRYCSIQWRWYNIKDLCILMTLISDPRDETTKKYIHRRFERRADIVDVMIATDWNGRPKQRTGMVCLDSLLERSS